MNNMEDVLTFSEQQGIEKIPTIRTPEGLKDAIKDFLMNAQVSAVFPTWCYLLVILIRHISYSNTSY